MRTVMVSLYPTLPLYEVSSCRNGLFYEIKRKADNATVFFQGDDALQLEYELEAASIVGQGAILEVCRAYDEVMSVDGVSQ